MESSLNHAPRAEAPPAKRGAALDAYAYAGPVAVHLEQFDRRVLAQASQFDPEIVAYLEYVLGCHGKRLRPTLALLCGAATGGVTERHLDLGVIVEMIHLATLVHDDIMDGASQRRGQATAAARWGADLAVLVGDCLFSHALKICSSHFPQQVSQAISSAVCEVCSGEILQTQRRFDLNLGLDDYLRIIRMKTGELFRVACELAGGVNQADAATCRALGVYGESLGVAYQIYDDCLDLLGTEAEAGKTLGTDLERGKVTLPFLYLLETVTGKEHEELCDALLHGTAESRRPLIDLAIERGAVRRTLATLDEHLAACARALEVLPPSAARDSLAEIAVSVGRQVASLPVAGD